MKTHLALPNSHFAHIKPPKVSDKIIFLCFKDVRTKEHQFLCTVKIYQCYCTQVPNTHLYSMLSNHTQGSYVVSITLASTILYQTSYSYIQPYYDQHI